MVATQLSAGLIPGCSACPPRSTSTPSLATRRHLSITARRRPSRLSCRAEAEVESSPAGAAEATQNGVPAGSSEGVGKKKSVIRRVKKPEAAETAADADLEMKSLDDPGTSVEGVVRLDKGTSLSLGQLVLLGAGDLVALTLFAWIGRATHVSAAVDFELLKTAAPFIIGWLVSATVFGDYSPTRSVPGGISGVAGDTAKTWGVGVPLGIAIRSLLKGQAPAVPFMVVSMVTTAVLLTTWWYAFFSLVAKDAGSAQASDKKGNVFEFFELLTSLVRRW